MQQDEEPSSPILDADVSGDVDMTSETLAPAEVEAMVQSDVSGLGTCTK